MDVEDGSNILETMGVASDQMLITPRTKEDAGEKSLPDNWVGRVTF